MINCFTNVTFNSIEHCIQLNKVQLLMVIIKLEGKIDVTKARCNMKLLNINNVYT